ncbi:hypothetical protein OKA04_15365 [Luteolibacter flavescens]|uniref:Cytochrome c domain-containing protein n=1 Tax=Luteolibacter flavescens TaxID=1859460 RepID=A0ABT3FRN5_9BACT|nr:hypothetical protein [Luteolibacter flavescens]MCW1886117.1 hypothetical protein [Luteolibacter flavescens]
MIRILSILLSLVAAAHARVHFEARHLHPVDITPDGAHVLAVNAPGGYLSVFTPGTAEHPAPLLVAEIPVGLEPVTVRARTSQEAWVVNEVSDTISVVDLTRRAVVCTLPVPDEPADVVFLGNRAFVSCGRANRIAVIDTITRAETASIPLEGNFVRALSLSPDGGTLRAAFLYPGNRTTVLGFRDAPPQPAPTNPSLPAPPATALIVPDSDPRIPYEVQDHDIAEIDTATLHVTGYRSGIGTNLHALAHSPDGTLWAASTDSRNLIRFEPALNGIFSESRIARVPAGDGSPVLHDLNPHATAPVIEAGEKERSLAQPMALLPTGDRMWLAAFASDRIAELDAYGRILRRIDLRNGEGDPLVRGPRGMVRHAGLGRIFVLNKLSGTLSVIAESTGTVVAEVPLAAIEALPASEKTGRGFFFDARRSGNGTVSCGSCHFDADHDGVAWDLGDPGGDIITVIERHLAFGETEPIPVPAHPMKGPMVTQSLRGIGEAAPFHWRGDKQLIQDFNPTFAKLQAGSELGAAQMDQVAAYLASLSNHPNPNRNLDDTLRTSLAGGNPVRGRELFHLHDTCSKCHPEPRGTNHNLDDRTTVLSSQPVKNSTLEHVYRKLGFTPDQPVSARGFGFTHDGSQHVLPRGHSYAAARFDRFPNGDADVLSYLLSFSTGTKPAVGASVTLRAGEATPADLATLMDQARQGSCDVVLRGVIAGKPVTFLHEANIGKWRSASGQLFTLDGILSTLSAGESLVALGVPQGQGAASSIDRNLNGVPDDAEALPSLRLVVPPALHQQGDADGWVIEHSHDLRSWLPAPTHPHEESDGWFRIDPLPPGPFYRMRRTW